MSRLVVDPGKIRQYGDPEGAVFCLVTNQSLVDQVDVVRTAPYSDYRTIVFEGDSDEFDRLMREEVPAEAHVLVMSPERFFISPPPDVLGPRRKLLGMACNSTPTTFETLRHFLRCIEETDPDAQEAFSDRFFELAELGDALEYHDARYGTVATLKLWERELVWNQQAGRVAWGEQQIVPAGEISVLPIDIQDFGEDLRLPLDGEIVIRGYPILHNGTPSFSRIDQKRIHRELWPLRTSAVKCTVENGQVTDMIALESGAERTVAMFDAMFEVDSRYRLVWEIGHAVNTTHTLLAGNHAMNEVYGGTQGCLHWGFGLTPYTQYHLDIISPQTVVTNDKGDALLGQVGAIAPERLVEAPVGLAS